MMPAVAVEDLNEGMPLARKLNDFVNQQQKFSSLNYNAILAVVVSIAFAILILIFLKYQEFLEESKEMYQTLLLMIDVPYEMGQISYQVNHIWSLFTKSYLPTKAQSFAPLAQATGRLAYELGAISAATMYVAFPLKYNEATQYNFSLAI
jgi:hypothetical protein